MLGVEFKGKPIFRFLPKILELGVRVEFKGKPNFRFLSNILELSARPGANVWFHFGIFYRSRWRRAHPFEFVARFWTFPKKTLWDLGFFVFLVNSKFLVPFWHLL